MADLIIDHEESLRGSEEVPATAVKRDGYQAADIFLAHMDTNIDDQRNENHAIAEAMEHNMYIHSMHAALEDHKDFCLGDLEQ